ELVIEQEEDAPPGGKVVAVAGFCLLVFAIGIGWVIAYLRAAPGASDLGGTTIPPELGRTQIGMVYQPLIEQDTRIRSTREAQRAALSSYGWVDRDAGVVHIPIEEAMRTLARTGGGTVP